MKALHMTSNSNTNLTDSQEVVGIQTIKGEQRIQVQNDIEDLNFNVE
tara:strand:- start:336 stop:476 length:141 start_codon:yes stop_codon:yes gene_type:complete